MAEFVMKNLVAAAGLSEKISVESSGTHASVGTPVSNGTRHELKTHGIPFDNRTSRQLSRDDYDKFDYIIGMDKMNVRDIKAICGGDPAGKIFLMMDFVGEHRDVDDPYVTDNYAATYADVSRACESLLQRLAQS